MEYFLGTIPVKKIVIVNDQRFVIPREDGQMGKDTDVHVVLPVTLEQLQRDDLSKKTLYVYPVPGDMAKKVFHVYYDRDADK